MKLVYKGKVLSDNQATLEQCAVDGTQAVFVAKGAAASTPAVAAPVAAAPGALAGTSAPVTPPPPSAAGGADSKTIRIELKPPGSAGPLELLVDPTSTTVGDLKVRAARETQIGITPQAMRLLRKGRILKDGENLAHLGVSDGERFMVAKG